MTSRHRRLVLILSALVAVLALSVVAMATAQDGDREGRDDRGGESQRPRTDQARTALVGQRRTQVRQTVCQGEDGQYREALEVFEGTATSDDPRLDGRLVVRVRSLINRSPDQQEGTVAGRIEIRDETSNRRKVLARFSAVSDDAATLEGTLTGRVFSGEGARSDDDDGGRSQRGRPDDEGRGRRGGGDDDRARGGERIFANFFGSFNAMDGERDFNVTLGQEPSTDSPRNSAVIQRGECPGGPGAPRP